MATVVTEPFWPCDDVWPPGTLRKAALMAYKLLDKRGVISLEKVIYNPRTDVTRVKYQSLFWGDDLKQLLYQTEGEACLIMADEYWKERE